MSRGLITIIKEQGVVPEALTTASGPSRQFATAKNDDRFWGKADLKGRRVLIASVENDPSATFADHRAAKSPSASQLRLGDPLASQGLAGE